MRVRDFLTALTAAAVFHLALFALAFTEALQTILNVFVAPGFAILRANGVGTREFPGPLIGLAFNLLIYSLVLWPIVAALRSRKERLRAGVIARQVIPAGRISRGGRVS